jgi:hypothetical protein
MATSTCQSRDCANPGTKVPGDELPQQVHLVDGSPRLSVNAFSIDDGTVKVSERLNALYSLVVAQPPPFTTRVTNFVAMLFLRRSSILFLGKGLVGVLNPSIEGHKRGLLCSFFEHEIYLSI